MDLSQFKWKNRLLLLFAPDASDPGYIDMWDAIHRHRHGMEDRELLVLSFFEEDGGDIDGEWIDEDSAEAIRRQFRIKRNMAAAVLIGKDGTEKRRDPLPAPLEKLFDLIDAMPMRRSEMEEEGD